MLQERQSISSAIANRGFIAIQYLAAEEGVEPEGADAPLDEAGRAEREYARRRLREELRREPTGQEVDEWLREQTEGY
jgi:hypothetical protein